MSAPSTRPLSAKPNLKVTAVCPKCVGLLTVQVYLHGFTVSLTDEAAGTFTPSVYGEIVMNCGGCGYYFRRFNRDGEGPQL
jgi:hypothetical protein